jgi:hypothetical protein
LRHLLQPHRQPLFRVPGARPDPQQGVVRGVGQPALRQGRLAALPGPALDVVACVLAQQVFQARRPRLQGDFLFCPAGRSGARESDLARMSAR